MTDTTDNLGPDPVISDTWQKEAGAFLVLMYGVSFGFYYIRHTPLAGALISPLGGLMAYLTVELYQSSEASGGKP